MHRVSSTTPKPHLIEHDQVALSRTDGPALWVVSRPFLKPYTRASTSSRLGQIQSPCTRYDSLSQMLFQMVPQQAIVRSVPLSSTSWQYNPAGIEFTHRFLAVSTYSAASSQIPPPPPDVVPNTVQPVTSAFIRCSLTPHATRACARRDTISDWCYLR
jgi:hypothetical protein